MSTKDDRKVVIRQEVEKSKTTENKTKSFQIQNIHSRLRLPHLKIIWFILCQTGSTDYHLAIATTFMVISVFIYNEFIKIIK